MPGSIAPLAAAEFIRRQQLAQRAVDGGRWTRAQATEALLPWLAIAARAGAELPELYDTVAAWNRDPATGCVALGDIQRRLYAADICPRSRWQPELIRARDTAAARLAADPGPDAERQAIALNTLAVSLCGSAAFTLPATVEQKEAA